MRDDEFRSWMEAQGNIQKRPIGDALSRCKRIETEMRISLDAEYAKDGGLNLLKTLAYTKADESRGLPAPEGLRIAEGANIYNAVSCIKSAAKKYFEFCSCH